MGAHEHVSPLALLVLLVIAVVDWIIYYIFFCKPKCKTFNIVIGGDVNYVIDVTREKQQSVY